MAAIATTANKVKYGLAKVYYALITVLDGVVSYGTPVEIPGAVNIALSPVGNLTRFYAGNMEYFTANANNGYSGKLEIALIPDTFRRDVLGETEDTNKVLFEDKTILTKPFALLFQFEGDIHAARHIMYNCKVNRPNIDGKTTGENIEVSTETLDIECKPAEDTGFVKAKTTKDTDATAYNGWYTAVYTKAAA